MRIHLAATLGVVSLGLAGCAGSGAQTTTSNDSEGVPMTVRVVTSAPGPEHFNSTPLIAYFDEVKKATDGRIDYEMYYGGSLVPAGEMGTALSDNTADAGVILGSYKPDTYVTSNWISQAAFVGEDGAPGSAMQKSAANLEWWMTHDEARQADWENNNIIPALPGVTPSAPYQMLCKTPIKSLADAAGKSIKTSGTAETQVAAALGMQSTSIPAAETFEAIQRGVVDCVFNNPGAMANNGFWDVAHEFTRVDMPPFITWGLFFSKAFWDSLPDEDKQILWEKLPVYISRDMKNSIDIESTFYKGAEDKGVTLHEPDPELTQAIEVHFDSVLAALPNDAPSAVSEPAKALDDYVALHEKWGSAMSSELGIESDIAWPEWIDSDPAPVDTDAFAQLLFDEVLKDRRPE